MAIFIIFIFCFLKHRKGAEKDVKDLFAKVNELCGIKESDTGLAMPHLWDVTADKQVS